MTGKLVRDKIPEIIAASGKKPITRILSDDEYIQELDKKLLEELDEYKEARSIEELADLLEIVLAYCGATGHTFADLFKAGAEKRATRGGFKHKIFWSGNE